jgi:hypothetical protein
MSTNSSKDALPIKPAGYRPKTFQKIIPMSNTKMWDMVKNKQLRLVNVAGINIIPASEVARLLGEIE